MNIQSFSTAINNAQESLLYYDPVYGTKYNKAKSSAVLASASAIGCVLGNQYDHPIVGCITGAVVTSGILWYVNKDKSQKPITDREVSLIRNKLALILEQKLQIKTCLVNKIQQDKTELTTTKAAVDTEINTNKRLAEEKLVAETKQYEQKFDEKMKALKMYLTGLGVLNYAYETKIKATGDGMNLLLALTTFEGNRSGSFIAVNTLLQAIPKNLREHSLVIRNMLSDIGSRPILRKIIGPVEQQHINTTNRLNQNKIEYHGIISEIAAAQKVYTMNIINGKVILPSINDFKRQMPA
jgi:hypothetical protein